VASVLADRLLAIHAALDAAAIPHAFGGAIALAYWTLEPRGTRDLDVNVFLSASDHQRAIDALPTPVDRPGDAGAQLARDGQGRLWWGDTPVDLFFNTDEFHEQAARRIRTVTFFDTEIPVLSALDLAVFKALFDRTKDWADIEAMFAARTLDFEALGEQLDRLMPGDAALQARVAEAHRRGLTAAS
jgi:hypothetical protein